MLNHWIRSLSARLWVTSVVALTITLAALAMTVIYAFDHFPEQTLGRHEQMETVTDVARGIIFDDVRGPVSVRLPEQTAWLFDSVPRELQYRVLDDHGNVLLASGDIRRNAPWSVGDLQQAVGKFESMTISGKQFYISTLRVPHGNEVFYAQTATSVRFIDAIIGAKVKQIPAGVKVTILAATIIFGLTLTFTVRHLLKPLRETSRAAAQITPRNLTTRLSLSGIPSEIQPLIIAFNEALDRLENGYSVQQQFLAAAAHELQTPLTLIRGQIEMQPEIESKELLFREIDHMARQVRQLLHLAEVSESQNFTFGSVNSVDIAQDVVLYLAPKANRMQVALQIKVLGMPSPIWADQSALFVLLKNFVENAINVSPQHSAVTMIIDDVSIQVRDEGPGIKQEYLPFLFKRFWRAPDASHDGAGLGLAICKEIAVAHEWRLTVKPLVSGTQFSVWF